MPNDPTPLIWNTPSKDSSGSMPLGNGDIGLNPWVEEDGDLRFYLSKTDAWDENARLLKLGRISVALSPNPFLAGRPFRQELDLAKGCIRITAGPVAATPSSRGNARGNGGEGDASSCSLLLWIDANRPVVRIGIESATPVEVRASVEIWRTEERTREGAEAHCPAGLRTAEERETVYPDTVLPTADDTITWCHQNRSSCWTDTLEHQDMDDWVGQGTDPLKNRTFGALLRGEAMVQNGACAIRTVAPQTHVHLAVHPLTSLAGSIEQWIDALTAQVAQTDAVAPEAAFAEHTAWWQAFWQRSWIKVSGTPEAETVSRGYELQRFINACGGRGAYPIKFNGSIFTVDAQEKNEVFDADYRRWGGGYWFQNTRLAYWPMIMSGDFDLMEPWFRLYLDALPFAKARAKANFGLDEAAMFPETMTFWGTFLNENYGSDRDGLQPGVAKNTFIRRYWQGMLELLAVLLDAHAVSQDKTLLRDTLLVLAPPFLRFYRDYFRERDAGGKMRLAPFQSLETWHEAVNPAPDIAGLRWVLDGLLALSEDELPGALRNELRTFRDILPPLPTRTYVWEKKWTEIIPALEYDQCLNIENPELYTVFPYRLLGVGKPDLEIGLATWQARRNKQTGGWHQDAIQAALLGLTDEAKAAVVKNFSTGHAGSRFPAFWGPNYDWIPDQDHGGVACIALQRMLMQCDDGKIRLLPAWPKDWNVDFRLHAPGKTTVECRLRSGNIEILKVTPESRLRDVVNGIKGV